ncbi:hypothetical protein LTR62_007118 [Meristemomyces frigidus]|uniref:Uncharacterized protein n=1 Tax=Meristemomyces frigidus TaxID=1508187 RepID=A0AAN7TMP9_9PEZI|nr:hypothetical protein LTR62_007118 [Meristemomyces frigidus]
MNLAPSSPNSNARDASGLMNAAHIAVAGRSPLPSQLVPKRLLDKRGVQARIVIFAKVGHGCAYF